MLVVVQCQGLDGIHVDAASFYFRHFEKKPERVTRDVISEQVRVRRREGYAAAERRLANREVTLCFVDENEVVG